MIISNLKKDINGKTILKNINLTLNNNDKAILVGNNGVGKSTLLKIINGDIKYDHGSINFNKESVSLLRQEININDYSKTISQYIKDQTGISELQKTLTALENNLNDSNMEEYGNILNEFINIDGYNFDENILEVLKGLNFSEKLDTSVNYLSGGEKIKILLAIILLKNSDIVLLDEPTNNLDMESICYLESKLVSSNKKMIIVSHDEEFISQIGNKIFELHDGIIDEYNMNYKEYMVKKENNYQRALFEHEKREAEKSKLKNEIEKSKAWESKGLNKKSSDNDKIVAGYQKERTKKTSGKISKLKDNLNKISADDGFREKQTINFFVDTASSKASMDIILNDLICGYDNFKIPELSIHIPFGTRLQISGQNGSGKTTLIKTIIGEIKPISGKVILGSGVKIGYISQDSFESTNQKETVEEYLTKNMNLDKSILFTILDKFHINYEDKDKIYSCLSPGERTRINLAKLAMNHVNILILDEATNHLDIEAIHILEDVIKSFNGTIISISHNRSFIDNLHPSMILNIKTGILEYAQDSNLSLKKS